jgi:hypothetical protein
MERFDDFLREKDVDLAEVYEMKAQLLRAGHTEDQANLYLKCNILATEHVKKGNTGQAMDVYNIGAKTVGKPLIKGISEVGPGKYHFSVASGEKFSYDPSSKDYPFQTIGPEKEVKGRAEEKKESDSDQGFKNDAQENRNGSEENKSREPSKPEPKRSTEKDVPRTPGGEPMLSFSSMGD